jgi:signal transduction histidine kinase
MLMIVFFLSYVDISIRAIHLFGAVGLTVAGLMFLQAADSFGNNQTIFMFLALTHVTAVLLIGVVIPLRYCLLVTSILFCAAVGEIYFSASLSMSDKVAFISGSTGIVCLMLFWVLIREREAKQQWLSDIERRHSADIQNSSSSYFFKLLKSEITTNCSAIERSLEALKTLRPESTYLQRSVHSFDQSLQLIDKLLSSVTWRVDDYRNIYPQFTFTLHEEASFRIVGDEVLLSRAISNLLDNAVRLHSPATIIEVAIRSPRQITIRNVGPPIPDNLETMFKYGASGNSVNRGLFGLGLFLAYQICQNHSAKLSAYQSGSKATFVIRFKT